MAWILIKLAEHAHEEANIRYLFDSISKQYDFLNHFLSGGIDFLWRRKAMNLIKPFRPMKILDIATGTADLAIEAARLKPNQIIGIDISEKMLEIGKKKISDRNQQNLIKLTLGKAENLEFQDNEFDAVISAFGVRNFENLELGLKECYRVLKSNGVLMILEFSLPKNFIIKNIYKFYLQNILPSVGGFFSKHKFAYEYLNSTISAFPDQTIFCNILQETGFINTASHTLTFGIATVYLATKP